MNSMKTEKRWCFLVLRCETRHRQSCDVCDTEMFIYDVADLIIYKHKETLMVLNRFVGSLVGSHSVAYGLFQQWFLVLTQTGGIFHRRMLCSRFVQNVSLHPSLNVKRMRLVASLHTFAIVPPQAHSVMCQQDLDGPHWVVKPQHWFQCELCLQVSPWLFMFMTPLPFCFLYCQLSQGCHAFREIWYEFAYVVYHSIESVYVYIAALACSQRLTPFWDLAWCPHCSQCLQQMSVPSLLAGTFSVQL